MKAYIAIDKKQREPLKALFKAMHVTEALFASRPVLVVDSFLKTVEFVSYLDMTRLDVTQMTDEELESILFAHFTGELEIDYQLRTF